MAEWAYNMLGSSVVTKLLLALFWVLVFSLGSRLLRRVVRNLGISRSLGDLRVRYIARLMNIGLVFCCIVIVCLVFGLGYSEVSVFLSSIFAVVGVALFAQWSILSNVTASLIIFFGFPYRVGDRIKILDGDADMSGVILDISSFHVILRRDDGNVITYPNTLILQKAVLKVRYPLQEEAGQPETEPAPADQTPSAGDTQVSNPGR